ncbi:uncharacterized protein LODBEIA_P05960 [Lodderomyces beijingensis]|uniref:SAC3/GANP/THP3 conserved domain-containing protein n=1 Tax=Lodderomyces beijingensis TaxID=1775926 RepID=A0ABP0ZDZ9_9ASCO
MSNCYNEVQPTIFKRGKGRGRGDSRGRGRGRGKRGTSNNNAGGDGGRGNFSQGNTESGYGQSNYNNGYPVSGYGFSNGGSGSYDNDHGSGRGQADTRRPDTPDDEFSGYSAPTKPEAMSFGGFSEAPPPRLSRNPELSPSVPQNNAASVDHYSHNEGASFNEEGRNPASSSEDVGSRTSSEDNPEIPPSATAFVETNLKRVFALSPEKQAIAKEQMGKLLRIAKTEKLFWANDWTAQRIPILDDNCELELECQRLERMRRQGKGPKQKITRKSPHHPPFAETVRRENFNHDPASTHENGAIVEEQPHGFLHNSTSFESSTVHDEPHTHNPPGIPLATRPLPREYDVDLLGVSLANASAKGHIHTNNDSGTIGFNDNLSSAAAESDTSSAMKPMSYADINAKHKGSDDYVSSERKRQRRERFELHPSNGSPSSASVLPTVSPDGSNSGAFVGKSVSLEKDYLRLTSAPDPDKVRPQWVLQRSIAHVLDKYHTMEVNIAYDYIKNQLKSIRQDLTVQHIKNEFAIEIYEQNARLSIKHNDLGEFNQCQTQLKNLYHMRRSSSSDPASPRRHCFISCELEMLCYRVIYMMITRNNSEIMKLKSLFARDYLEFAYPEPHQIYLELINALFRCNFNKLTTNSIRFFSQLATFKHKRDTALALQMIDNFLADKVRLVQLGNVCASYHKMSLRVLSSLLAFPQDEESGDECRRFLNRLKLAAPFISNEDFDAKRAKSAVMAKIASSQKVDIKGQK